MATKCAYDHSFQIKKCTKQVMIKYNTTTQTFAAFFTGIYLHLKTLAMWKGKHKASNTEQEVSLAHA